MDDSATRDGGGPAAVGAERKCAVGAVVSGARWVITMFLAFLAALVAAAWLIRRGVPAPIAVAVPCVGMCYVGYRLERPYELRHERKAKGLCVRRAYDMRGNVSGVCPECGKKAKPG